MHFIRGSLVLLSRRGFLDRGGLNAGIMNGRLLHLSSGLEGKFLPTKVKLDKGREVKWCSCGKTKQQPFCDGSDSCNGKPMAFKAAESKEYAFCNCKQSQRSPLCDGTHAK